MANVDYQLGPEDAELLCEVLALNPDLEIVAYLTRDARRHLKYPLGSIDDLRPLFRGKGQIFRCKDFVISLSRLKSIVPDEFFPIQSERDFMQKALMTLAIGHRGHLRPEEIQRLAFARIAAATMDLAIPPAARQDLTTKRRSNVRRSSR